jgi:hypothetical protein
VHDVHHIWFSPQQKPTALPRFVGENQKKVLEYHERLEPYDETKHASVSPTDIVTLDGGLKRVRVRLEYRANLYELCLPLLTIFKSAVTYILTKEDYKQAFLDKPTGQQNRGR